MTHEDTNQEPVVAATEVRSRALTGIKALGARTLASVLLRMVSSLTLAHLLFPHDYGVFGIASYITGLGLFLSDVGLGGALVRQSREPSRDETFSVFCSQQAITALVVFAVIATAPMLEHLYHLSGSATLLLHVMAFGLFLSSMRVVPMMALERSLKFPLVARCELIQNIAQTTGTITLALLHTGPWALAGGGLIGGTTGLICVWAASPWRPQGRFQWPIVVRLARFGLPFQLNALVPTIIGGWMPLVVGRLLGVAAVGLVGWATNIASVPMMFSGILNRVAFPAYSRLQSDPAALSHYVTTSLRRLSTVLCLLVPLMVIVCPVAIPLIFGKRWLLAIPLVQWFSVEIVLLTLNGILCAVQNATGFPGDRLGVALGTGLMRWGVGYAAIRWFGLRGIGPATCFVSSVELALSVYLVGHRHAACRNLAWSVAKPLLTMMVMLGSAVGLGWLLAADHSWLRAGIAAVLFLALFLTHGLMTGESKAEWNGLVRMLRPTAKEITA
jgi:teichuronic acid exporter